jgi:hypothetical protein
MKQLSESCPFFVGVADSEQASAGRRRKGRNMGISDEIGTGSLSPDETEQTPDTEVKNMGNEAESGELSNVAEGDARKPQLSKDQQEWLNKVFIPNFRKELMRQVQFDKKQVEQSRRELERRKKEQEAQMRSFQVTREENEKLVRKISDLKIDQALISAAAGSNAVNPDQVRKLLKDRVELGENLDPVVLDEKGERQLNRNGEFMTVEEQVKLFLAENPHLVKASPAKGGSGSIRSAGQASAAAGMTSGDLITEGLIEEKRTPPTRTLAEFEG